MMTSVGIERARDTRDKALPTTTQTTQPQKQLQATAEQIRLAQMIYDKNDADFEDKVMQLIEVTGKNQDDCMVALHDCNEDVNRAINFLLEGTSDATSWETVGKKKSLGKDGTSTESKENKENREKKERESSRGRGGASRRGRGTSRNRPARTEENGVEPAPVERGADRGRRGRGRVSGGRGRGRAPVTSRFTAQGMGTFNPADYTTDSGTSNSHADVWETGANDTTDGTGERLASVAQNFSRSFGPVSSLFLSLTHSVPWQNTLDEWAAEDWSEDLSETKVFTSSCAPPTENHITPGQSLDLSSLLQKPVDREEAEGLKAVGSSQGLGHSLVFTNSHHQPARNGGTSSGPNSYTHATLSSVLGSGFGELGGPKLGQTAGQQILEQLKGPGLGQLTSPPSSTGTNCTPVGGLVGTGISVPSSSWDIKPPGTQSSASLSSQFSREFQMQPEPSLVLSQLSQRQQGSLTHTGPLARQPSPPPLSAPSPASGTLEAFPKAPEPSQHRDGPSMAPSQAAESQGSSTQQRQIKTQKRRIPPTSKIPASAVEMPGSADVSGLNVQFGALDFGSESALPDFGQSENCNSEPIREAAVVPQSQSSLYSKPISESLTSPVPLLLPLASSDSIYPSPSVPLPSLAPSHTTPSSVTAPSSSLSSSSSSAASSAGNSFDCGVAPHSRLTFSQSKELSGPVTNGFNGARTSAALDTTSSSSTPKQESPSLVSSTSVAPSAPSSLLPPSVTPHSSVLPSLASELSSASLPPLSSHVSSGHPSVSALCTTSSLTYTSVDSVNSLAPSSMAFSSQPVSALSSGSVNNATSGGNSLHGSGILGHGTNGSALSGIRAAPLLSSSSGKAPPNLSQGVPPLLPNQYIMGPGGLLPAYPIYGYEDLHMLQSRLPMDYYGITFPGPTATLSGRDGSLANNPYSGDITKFGRGESASPAPSASLSAAHGPQTAQPPQAQSQGQNQPQPQGHHNTQQTFLNPALPPGYSYTGLPYYPGVPGVPSAFQYGPTMFVPPNSAKQHGMGLSNPTTPFQQPSGYGQHAFSSGYDDLTQGPAGTEYSKGYSNSSQTQAKSAASGPGKVVSVTSSNSGVPDISGTVYNKTQPFDKQGFHAGTPPPFNLPSALGGTGPLTPGAAPGYPAPFLHILPAHQQPHSQLLHHHLTQDGQGGPNQRSQSSVMQQKTQVNKSNYGSSPYWGN
ncbi:ubiquitin-associated protein 2a isoform X4 [Pimephales promelas]|uniref:ubiquitin-associated protein 2a isoform X4 n=1 Tax=Pimephales promelas TaxID=90988 RepID=UPI001955E213|nr:ubiquitin-associated protein 2a isoform X4 [Pimephales promelas]